MTHNSNATNSGLSNPAETISYVEITAVDDAGFVVKAATTAGCVDVTTAMTDIPIGYTFRDTTTPANVQSGGDPSANVRVGIQALINGQEAYLQLAPSNAAITPGDPIAATANGQVDKATNGGAHYFVIGVALEAKDASTGVAVNTGTTTTNQTIKVRIISPYYI